MNVTKDRSSFKHELIQIALNETIRDTLYALDTLIDRLDPSEKPQKANENTKEVFTSLIGFLDNTSEALINFRDGVLNRMETIQIKLFGASG